MHRPRGGFLLPATSGLTGSNRGEPMQEANVVTSENSAEFYAAKLNLPASAPAEAVVKTEPVVEKPSGKESTEQPENKASEAGEAPKPKTEPNPKLEKRFSELTKQREEAKRATEAANARAEAAEKKAAELEAKLNPPKAGDANAKPQPAQF